MPGLWILLSLIFTCTAESNNTHMTSVLKNIYKRETYCGEGLHPDESRQRCCQLCPAGQWKFKDCEVNEGNPVCKPCEEGKEYTEKENYLPKCVKCGHCDEGHGSEVETPCTRIQNIKCRCRKNFFCVSSPCYQCEPCTTCNYGYIEECTPTSNAKCKEKGQSKLNLLWLLVLIVIPTVPITIIYVIKKRKRGKKTLHTPLELTEMEQMTLTDVDLSKYINLIAEQMTIHEVKEFVRKSDIEEAKIDEIMNNYPHDTAEQKLQLLRTWHQLHGKKGAYVTLIEGFKKAKLFAHARRIQVLIKKETSRNGETAGFKNENERQSLAET